MMLVIAHKWKKILPDDAFEKGINHMDARSALAATAITMVTLPASGHIGTVAETAISGPHITGDREFERGMSAHANEVGGPGHVVVHSFTTGLLTRRTHSKRAVITVHTMRAESIGEKIAGYAREFVGRARYEYGATGPRAFDCSGLAQYVYRHFGRAIPRTAQAQYQYFRPESRRRAHPGDLVFFGGSSVTHVGIFEGGDMMVAAATPLEGIRYQQIYSSSATFGAMAR
jgi:cell wall-associated NlpC family hydrolase